MLINRAIWNATIAEAKRKSAGNDYILRAIERAKAEVEKASYWSFNNGVLKIKSTTSGKLYIVDDVHTCESKKTCKHKVARRLVQRYSERLSA